MATKLTSLIGAALQRRRAFLRHQKGATLVEFGLLALPFFSIVGAILETSVVFLAGQVLDSAVQDVSRYLRTGQAQEAAVDLDRFRDEVCERLYNLFSNCDSLHVEVNTITDFSSVSITPPVDWTCEEDEEEPCDWTRPEAYPDGYAASPSAVMVVQVYYKWPIMLSLGGMSLANLPGGKRLLGSATVFRNEPFPGA